MSATIGSEEATVENENDVLLVAVIRKSYRDTFAVSCGEVRCQLILPFVYHESEPPVRRTDPELWLDNPHTGSREPGTATLLGRMTGWSNTEELPDENHPYSPRETLSDNQDFIY